MSSDEIKLGYLLLQFLRVAAASRAVHKFNVIGRSTQGEFEQWVHRELTRSEKQTLIWIWDELNRARLINATGEDLVDADSWVMVSPKGLMISESEFAATFSTEAHSDRKAEKLTDYLTGIFQKSELDNDLAQIVNRQNNDSPTAFVMIDIDHFKAFNDTHGHPTGDEVLRLVAQSVAKVVREKGEAYRYGGEEISVILPNHNLAEATAVAERIRGQIESARIESLPGCAVTASLGVAAIPETSENVETMVADADRAMYQAKDGGRNRVCYATKQSSGQPAQSKTVKLEGDLVMWVRLQSSERSWCLLEIENQTNVEIRIERIAFQHEGIALVEPAAPNDGEKWILPPKATRPIGWRPKTNAGDSLVRLYPNEGIFFSSWMMVILYVSIGNERREYQQKLAVGVSATNGQIRQLAG